MYICLDMLTRMRTDMCRVYICVDVLFNFVALADENEWLRGLDIDSVNAGVTTRVQT